MDKEKQKHVVHTVGQFPSKEKPHGRAGNRTWELFISPQRRYH